MRPATGRLAPDVFPYWREEPPIVVGVDSTQHLLIGGRLPVPGLAQHDDGLDIVLDDAVRKIGLSEIPTALRRFELEVRHLQPPDRREIVEADAAGANLNVGGQRRHVVSARRAPRQADVAHDAANTPTGDEDSGALGPHRSSSARKASYSSTLLGSVPFPNCPAASPYCFKSPYGGEVTTRCTLWSASHDRIGFAERSAHCRDTG